MGQLRSESARHAVEETGVARCAVGARTAAKTVLEVVDRRCAPGRCVPCVACARLARHARTVGSVSECAVRAPVVSVACIVSECHCVVGRVRRVATLQVAHCAPQAVVPASSVTPCDPVTVVRVVAPVAIGVVQVVVLAAARVVHGIGAQVAITGSVVVVLRSTVGAGVVGSVSGVTLSIEPSTSVVVVALEVRCGGSVGRVGLVGSTVEDPACVSVGRVSGLAATSHPVAVRQLRT